MNKKGMETLEWVAVMIIFSIVLILVLAAFLAPKTGLFNNFTSFVETAKKYLPGRGEIEVQEIKPSERFDDFFNKFSASLNKAKVEDERCIIEYEKFNDFEGFKVEIFNDKNNLVLRKKDALGRATEQKTIEKLNLCLIEPNAFYENYLKGQPCKNNCKKDYIDKTSITFTANELEEFGLQDNGLIYKPTKDKLCFIPTHKTGITWYKALWEVFTKYGCEADKDTLDNDCIEKIQNIKKCGKK